MTSSDHLKRIIRRTPLFGIWAAGIYSDALAMGTPDSELSDLFNRFPVTGVIYAPWRSVVVAAALVLGAANMITTTAFARGISAAANSFGTGFAAEKLPIRHGFVRPFRKNLAFRKGLGLRRNFATGVLWPYYDYFPTDTYGEMDTTTFPATGGFVPAPMPVPGCQRSEETVRVPRESGGKSANIKIIRCP